MKAIGDAIALEAVYQAVCRRIGPIDRLAFLLAVQEIAERRV